MTEYHGFCHPHLSGKEEASLLTTAPVTDNSENSDSHRGFVGDPGLLDCDVMKTDTHVLDFLNHLACYFLSVCVFN